MSAITAAVATLPLPLHRLSSTPDHHTRCSLDSASVFVYSEDQDSPSHPYHSFPEHDYVTSLIRRAHAQHNQHHHFYHHHLRSGKQPSSHLSSIRPVQRPLSPVTEICTPPAPVFKPKRPSVRVRSLIESNSSMTTVETAPGSPPDLTNSKSSKSSSFQSSGLSDIAGPHDIAHFEDIALDDVANGEPIQHHDLYTGRRLLGKQTSMTSLRSRTPSQPPAAPARDLTSSASRPSFPMPMINTNVQNAGYNREHSSSSLNLPTRRHTTRGLRSPSAQSLGTYDRHSRSPSPAQRLQQGPRSLSRSPSSSRSSGGSTLGMQGATLTRTLSWQSGRRKSVRELEAEIDDKDDDIPDDAIVFNVPISPRLPHERPLSGSPSAPSPLKEGMSAQLKHVSAPPALSRQSSKLSLRSDTSPVSDTIPDRNLYSSALEFLDEDARHLTEALEAHATLQDKKREERVQAGRGSSDAKKTGNGKTLMGMIELPPLQRPDMMIDPLPISKEKEAVLSRTRPSHLPPKSKEEEEKHLKQYQKMMAAAQEAEKKRIAKLRADLDTKDLEEASKVNLWRQLILPQWDLYRQDRRTRELWWRGVPPATRGKAWVAGVGNELELTAESFRLALSKGQERLKEEEKMEEGERTLTKVLDDLCEMSWPEEKLFQKDMPCYDAHRDVLLAYAMYRPDVNLVVGISLLASLLTLNMDPANAFVTLANLLNRPTPLAFALGDEGRIHTVYANIVKLIQIKLPALYAHFVEKLGLQPEEYLGNIMYGLSCKGLGVDAASRIWDVIIFEGDRGFVRSAVGILKVLEPRLYVEREEVMDILSGDGEKKWVQNSADDFMIVVRDCGKVN